MRKIRGTNWEAKDTDKLRTKALEICESARAQLVLKHPFVGRLGIHIPFIPVVDARVRTIATNGKVIYVRPEWLCRMPPVTTVATVAHTIWTAALCHSFRRGDTDPMKFDLASDLEVYTLLRTEKVGMAFKPEFADVFPKHLPVEKIAQDLPDVKLLRHMDSDVHLYTAGVISLPSLPGEEKQEKQSENEADKEDSKFGKGKDGDKSQDRKSGSGGKGQKGSKSREKQEPGSGGKQQKGGKSGEEQEPGSGEDEKSGDQSSAGNDAQNASGQDEANDSQEYDGEVDTSCDPAMREVWRQRIIEAGQQYKMVYGDLPGELAELVQSFQEGKVDYLQLLRRYLGRANGGESHWLPPARRFVWQGLYLPSHTNPKIDIVVAVDTSGSIDEEQFRQIFGEIVSIVRGFPNYRLTLIQCDAEIQSVEEYSANNPFDPKNGIKINGRGGTDFCPVFDYVKQNKLNPKVLLYYTDGEGTFPGKAPQYPVIWLLQNGNKKRIPWGKIIEINGSVKNENGMDRWRIEGN